MTNEDYLRNKCLTGDVLRFCIEEDKKVLARHPHTPSHNIKIKEWPATVASCCFDRTFICHEICKPPTNVIFDPRITGEFSKLGGLKGDKVAGCDYPLGNCAEQRAANLLLDKTISTTYNKSVKEIHFSCAYRPRTMQVIPMCNNCKSIFK